MIGLFVGKTSVTLVALCTVILMAACGQNTDNAPASAGVSAARNTTVPAAETDKSGPDNSQRGVVAETLAYAEIDEHLVKGHFVFPEDMVDSLPAIILIHEWWGLDDRIRALADQIAGQGFVVLAIDLYGGQTATLPADARLLMLDVVEQPEFAAQNIRQAYDWVLATAGATQVGVVGYGLGGAWSLNAAIDLPEKLDAAVMFYGQVSDNEKTLAPVTAPILGFFGGADSVIRADSIVRFESALKKLNKVHEIEIYPDAKGGFASPGNRNYDKNLALKSWDRMLGFLHQYLTKAEDTAA